ncbi:MAG: hypothetical protein IT386_15760, partial [Deltaproteobacteria bacterium]|nr:hypothetical protein [Deltaproteobacteria bacterium]
MRPVLAPPRSQAETRVGEKTGIAGCTRGRSLLSAETHWENHDASGEVSSDRSLYNYFRTYDPATGRYLEADPIGQRGGLNP